MKHMFQVPCLEQDRLVSCPESLVYISDIIIGPMKGGQSVECQGQIFGNVASRLENGRVECRHYIL